jgi:hypothetical protein
VCVFALFSGVVCLCVVFYFGGSYKYAYCIRVKETRVLYSYRVMLCIYSNIGSLFSYLKLLCVIMAMCYSITTDSLSQVAVL